MSTTVLNNATLNAFEEAFNSVNRTPQQIAAFDAFCKMGLPTSKAEEYRFTPIGKFLEANFDLSLYGQALETQTSKPVQEDCISITIINGNLIVDETELVQSGISVSMRDVSNLFSKADSFVVLNHAFIDKEIHINISKNVIVEKAIALHHIMDSEAGQIMQNTRIAMDLGENSSCNIIESFHSTGIHPVFTNVVSEYRLHTNARLNYYRLQNDAGAYQVYHSTIRQLGKSEVNSFIFSFDGNVIRNNSIFSIEAEHCESNFYGLYLPSGKSLIDNHTVADHRVAHCVSNELYKGIMSDNGKGVFNGKIFVRPDAQKTNAFQSNRNILLSDTAFVNTKPQLEIWADDVKCSHGCTTGQLDKEALFYLQSRGISNENAKTMLLSAFASEVINKIQDQNLRAEIEKLVSYRLHNPY